MTGMTVLDRSSWQTDRNSKYGKRPRERSVDEYIKFGFIVLDKPAGPTSHDVVATVKKILGISKAGHLGTLDPNVSGVLPIALEKGTKILSSLKGATKEYICNLFVLEIIEAEVIQSVIAQFEEEIFQVPPLKSNVAKRLRSRVIHMIDCLEFAGKEILLKIRCDAGTYIRTLCKDIGRAAGTGGMMKELRRVRSGKFDEIRAVTLHDLFDAYAEFEEGISQDKLREVIQPIETVISHLPTVLIRDNAVARLCHGTNVCLDDILAYEEFEEGSTVGLKTAKEELIALGQALVSSAGIKERESEDLIHPDSVVMDRQAYMTR